MQLETLPVDAWIWFQEYLNGFHICRLALCGNKRLNERLYRSVTAIYFQWASGTEKLGWPPMLQNFHRLRKFDYSSSLAPSSVEYYPTVADIALIPPSVKEIRLCCDGAEVVFRNSNSALAEIENSAGNHHYTREHQLYTDEKDWFNPSERWPQLEKLYLRQFSSYKAATPYFGPTMHLLPSNLLYLKLLCCKDLTTEEIAAIPRHLTTLDVRQTEFSPEQIAELPRTIINLTISIGRSHNSVREVKWPTALRKLRIHNVRDDYLLEDTFDWQTLENLLSLRIEDWYTSMDLEGFVRSLMKLKRLIIFTFNKALDYTLLASQLTPHPALFMINGDTIYERKNHCIGDEFVLVSDIHSMSNVPATAKAMIEQQLEFENLKLQDG